jgi:hypothetical protein
MDRRSFLKAVVAGGAALAGGGFAARAAPAATMPRTALGSPALREDLVLHVLNRVTWGYRPKDRATVDRIGLSAFIEAQLAPERIEDPEIDAFVAGERFLTMNRSDLSRVAGERYGDVLQTALWARYYRAAYSERQLYEKMVEFWTDHFNIPIADALAEKMIDDRDVIRRHAMGSFRDLLLASAQSPAMLWYLDNASSTAEHPNENYAREIMELHTLGVDGGYTEADVREVARAFTGWGVREDFQDEFYFNTYEHDTGEKTVLGRTLAAGRGIEDGLEVIDLLATHPSTARFIAAKLCLRFIGDDAPASIIESTAKAFSTSAGDMRAVLRHLFASSEFIGSARGKYRRPFEFQIAVMRALGPAFAVSNPEWFVWSLESLGHVPYYWHPPNGYPDRAEAWISANGLLGRWNLAMQMALSGEGWFGEGVSLDIRRVFTPQPTVGTTIDTAAAHVLGGPLDPAWRAVFVNALTDGSGDEHAPIDADGHDWLAPTLLGLLFQSPDFQWS